MWFQRQKQVCSVAPFAFVPSSRRNLKEAAAQYLLANGIAVVVANTRLFDGWNIDLASWKTGEDPVRTTVLSTTFPRS